MSETTTLALNKHEINLKQSNPAQKKPKTPNMVFLYYAPHLKPETQ